MTFESNKIYIYHLNGQATAQRWSDNTGILLYYFSQSMNIYIYMHRLLSLSKMLHSYLLILNKPVYILSVCWIEKTNALIICHPIAAHATTVKTLRWNCSICCFVVVFLSRFVPVISPHLLLSCTSSPNISYAISRLLMLNLPLSRHLLTEWLSSRIHFTTGLCFSLANSLGFEFLGMFGD